MGISKAMAEKIAIAKSRTIKKTPIICITRYGNVMGSRGSVIPLFVNQIKQNKNLTITDPNMTRFLMSLEDSVKLVLSAFKYGKSCEIFAQKAPAANIGTLAKTLKKILNSKSKIKIIGTRHGEKLFETLVSREELARSIEKESYYKILHDNRDLNYNNFYSKGLKFINNISDYNSHNTKQLSEKEISKLLFKSNLIKDIIDV